MKKQLAALAAACLGGSLALIPVRLQGSTSDDDSGPQVRAKITDAVGDRFTAFAGSEANADALVTGLREGTSITLTQTVNGQVVTTTFTPDTGKLGFGNAAIALGLAREDLAKLGIKDPTPAQIEAALNGGSVTTGSGSAGTTTTLPGVLALHASGQGWGKVAGDLGVKLGPVVRSWDRTEAHIDHVQALAMADKADIGRDAAKPPTPNAAVNANAAAAAANARAAAETSASVHHAAVTPPVIPPMDLARAPGRH